MAAQVVTKLPEGEDWIYELKFDGYRVLIIRNLGLGFYISQAIA
jgi:ATP-dependent DNA ligase